MGLFKGKYRDIVLENDIPLIDTGWKSNRIQKDFGKYIAALLIKQFNKSIGIEYLVVGGPSNSSEEYEDTGDNDFGDRIGEYFKKFKKGEVTDLRFLGPKDIGDYWVCAVKPAISFIPPPVDTNSKGSNQLEISYTFPKEILSQRPYCFREFSLVGSELNENDDHDDKLFKRVYMLNYVVHGLYTKDEKVSLKRVISLTFPLE